MLNLLTTSNLKKGTKANLSKLFSLQKVAIDVALKDLHINTDS